MDCCVGLESFSVPHKGGFTRWVICRNSVSLRVVRAVGLNVKVSRGNGKRNIIPLKGSKLTDLNVS